MSEENLIAYDKMKDQIEKEVLSFLEKGGAPAEVAVPKISFEKGSTSISFQLPHMGDTMLTNVLLIIKKHIAHVRIHAFDEGYYAFQALNKNMFNTENILDNLKVELFGLSTQSRIEVLKKGNLTQEEVNLVIEVFKYAFSSYQEDPALRLRKLGASVYVDSSGVGWDYIAGYEEVKRNIRESIILPLKNPEVYDTIARMTRKMFESNRPRAILFEGPPGVGKTTVARIISSEASIPLVYVPIESIMSKWYGQSSQNLSAIFDACDQMGGAIIFLDEIDSLAGSRDQNMFEATRRILSVLLRRLEGIDAVENTLTIGATNRMTDLDHALISRFDQTIHFPLPNPEERASIYSNYATQLSEEECAHLGDRSENLSGRNIKDICEFAERRWVRKLLVKKSEPSPPPFEYYRHALQVWKK